MLGLLSDYGLAGEICRAHKVTACDLEQLALLEMECRELAKEKAPKGE